MEQERIEKENPKNMKYSDRKHLGYESWVCQKLEMNFF
jgi:hypothetical protein